MIVVLQTFESRHWYPPSASWSLVRHPTLKTFWSELKTSEPNSYGWNKCTDIAALIWNHTERKRISWKYRSDSHNSFPLLTLKHHPLEWSAMLVIVIQIPSYSVSKGESNGQGETLQDPVKRLLFTRLRHLVINSLLGKNKSFRPAKFDRNFARPNSFEPINTPSRGKPLSTFRIAMRNVAPTSFLSSSNNF